MKNQNIHPSAIVSDKAKIGNNVTIGAFSIIEDDVEIGNNCEIRSSVVIANGARIGNNVKIFHGAVISTEPQDLKYKNEQTFVRIGDNTEIREYATINRATTATYETIVGSNCLIMTYCHVAHDCRLGDNIIISNASQLGGHVEIEDWVILGGVTKVHQFCRIGCHAMVGADVKITKDVPPYTLIGREPARVEGINKVGLRRRGFSKETITGIENFYDTILFSGLNTGDGIKSFVAKNNISDEVKHCVEYIEKSSRGIYR